MNLGTYLVKNDLTALEAYTTTLRQLDALLEPDPQLAITERRNRFKALAATLISDPDPVNRHIGKTMQGWKDGLFADFDLLGLPRDNLDLERFFRLPKRYARHVHGHAHAGARIVYEGPTLIPVLDAHRAHPEPFSLKELLPYLEAAPPENQTEALSGRRIMRRARNREERTRLLVELETAYNSGVPLRTAPSRKPARPMRDPSSAPHPYRPGRRLTTRPTLSDSPHSRSTSSAQPTLQI